MHRTRALNAVRAAARLRVLASHRCHDDEEHEEAGGDRGLSAVADVEQPLLPRDTAEQQGSGAFGPADAPAQQDQGRRGPSALAASAALSDGGQQAAPAPSPSPPPLQQQQQLRASARDEALLPAAAAAAAAAAPAGAATPGRSPLFCAHRASPSREASARSVRRAAADLHPLASRPVTPVAKEAAWYVRDGVALRDMLMSSYFSLLLAAVPLGVMAHLLGWGPVAVFTLNFLALIPLALLLGDVTEDLALRFGDVVGGLLNATFGNVVEVILSITALMRGLYTVVATSLLGSILSNLLLVLGCCFLFGGMRYQTQTFNPTANHATSSLLFLSCIAIGLPTAASSLKPGGTSHDRWILEASRGTAVVLLIIYACYLVFQLHSHNDLFCSEDEDAQPTLTLAASLGVLAGVTALVTLASE